MEQKKIVSFFSMLWLVFVGFGQQNNTIVLDEVILSDAKLLHFSNGVKVQVLKDSVLQRNGSSLTDVLRYNSSIYFKENGYGMVSSVSFRGTNASQTAVVWNGINLNSQLTGQTDFNTISPQGFNEIVVRSGGGSVQYGSGAIGGTILLNNVLDFSKHYESHLRIGYGSFETKKLNYVTSFGNKKIALGFGLNYNASENDYKYLGTDLINENGALENLNLNLDFGYTIADHHLIKFFHNSFFGDRDFSGTLTAPSNDNYKNSDSRSLVEWDNFRANKIARLKFAHLYEEYKYFANKERDDFSFGRTNTFIVNYDYKYSWDALILNGIVDVNSISAKGTSIESANRNTISGIFLVSHKLSDNFNYGVNIRKDFVNDYESPLLLSLDSEYQLTKHYAININASKNYRLPTFNDLYWIGAGNLDVEPETSFQLELGQALENESYKLKLNAFYIKSDELIQWRPNAEGIWSPINIADASQYGVELSLEANHSWGNNHVLWNNQYGYTKSVNNETNYQLTYVPEHNINSNLAYCYKKWSAQYQFLYTGIVYTTNDNSESLDDYIVNNMRLEYKLKLTTIAEIRLGFSVNNIFNKAYENVAFRPMPNRNYQLELLTKF